MKSSSAVALLLVAVVLPAGPWTAAAQKTDSQPVPQYDAASEAIFKGTVIDVVDRQCPVSGGLGAHLNLKLEDGKTIEVHLAPTRFAKSFDLIFNKGDKVEVVGVKVQFEEKQTIFAREITRETETFTFREKNGEPAW